MKKKILPKVIAFLALFGVFISLVSVALLSVFSPSSRGESKTFTQDELKELMKNYEAFSWSVNVDSWVVDVIGGIDEKGGTWIVLSSTWWSEIGTWVSE